MGASKKKAIEAVALQQPTYKPGHVIELPPIEETLVVVKIVGISPLILNPFTEKAIEEMLGAQGGRARLRRPKVVQDEVENRIQRIEDGRIGFNAMSFKKAMISAAAMVPKIKSTHIKQGVFFEPDGFCGITAVVALDIEGEPQPLKAHVRNATGVADVRVRPIIHSWSAELKMVLQTHVISLEQAINVLRLAGRGVGIGDWRPEKTGVYGRFEVKSVMVGG